MRVHLHSNPSTLTPALSAPTSQVARSPLIPLILESMREDMQILLDEWVLPNKLDITSDEQGESGVQLNLVFKGTIACLTQFFQIHYNENVVSSDVTLKSREVAETANELLKALEENSEHEAPMIKLVNLLDILQKKSLITLTASFEGSETKARAQAGALVVTDMETTSAHTPQDALSR